MLFPPSLTIYLPSVCLVSCVVLRWYCLCVALTLYHNVTCNRFKMHTDTGSPCYRSPSLSRPSLALTYPWLDRLERWCRLLKYIIFYDNKLKDSSLTRTLLLPHKKTVIAIFRQNVKVAKGSRILVSMHPIFFMAILLMGLQKTTERHVPRRIK